MIPYQIYDTFSLYLSLVFSYGCISFSWLSLKYRHILHKKYREMVLLLSLVFSCSWTKIRKFPENFPKISAFFLNTRRYGIQKAPYRTAFATVISVSVLKDITFPRVFGHKTFKHFAQKAVKIIPGGLTT